MENKILEYLKKANKWIEINKLKHELRIKGEDSQKEFNNLLKKLEENAKIIIIKDQIMSFNKNYSQGNIQINSKGVAYLNGFIIPPNYLHGALNNDLVLICDSNKYFENHKIAEVKKIIKRKKDIIPCLYQDNKLIACADTLNDNIIVDQKSLSDLAENDIISVHLKNDFNKDGISGEIINLEVDKSDPNYGEKLIAIRHGFPLEFPKEVLDEVEKIDDTITEKDIKERIDLRDKLIFTIDCDDTKDMDDAISIEKLNNGNYKLGVHIADVHHYVKIDSKTSKEALKRGVSGYLNDLVIPMFPKRLSNGICSLNPNEDKLTLSVDLIIDKHGNILDHHFYKSIINSRKKMKYSQVAALIQNGEGKESFSDEETKALLEMAKLTLILEKCKEKRGCLKFPSQELDIVYDENNNPIDAFNHIQNIAQLLIENSMLSANETYATNYSWMPFIYRTHDKPNEQGLKSELAFINANLEKLPKIKNFDNPSEISKLLESIKDSPLYNIIADMILKEMARAKYSTNSLGHFGLALNNYSHNTSPIRRYVDYTCQFLIDNQEKIINDEKFRERIEKELIQIAEHVNEREYEADKAEMEAIDLKLAKTMQNRIGEEFEAKVVEINPNFLKISINGIKGIITSNNILDDKYCFNPNKRCFYGRHSKEIIKIGNTVKVRLTKVHLEFGLIEFVCLEKIKQEIKPNQMKRCRQKPAIESI